MKDPPVPISDMEYANIVREEHSALLADETAMEIEWHQLFETHPCLLPSHRASSHYPVFGALLSEPVLQGSIQRRPDFMWLASDSSSVQPVIFEIERPDKKCWRADGQLTAEFSQAIQQICDWQAWFLSTTHQQLFREFYNLNEGTMSYRPLMPLYYLVYGRREEANLSSHLLNKRNIAMPPRTRHITFDGLAPDSSLMRYPSARRRTVPIEPRIDFISVPPTFKLGNCMPSEWHSANRRQEAIAENDYMSDDRKRFLVERLEYWDTNRKMPGPRFERVGEWE